MAGHPCDCVPEGPFRRSLARAANSALLNHASTSLVLLNMVLMCMPYQGMPTAYAYTLEESATIISLLFIGEMALKLVGLGCAGPYEGWGQGQGQGQG